MRLAYADAILTYASDEKYAEFHDQVPDLHQTEEFVAHHVTAPWKDDPRFSIALDSQVIGGIGLTIDRKYTHGELAYSLALEHWGQGPRGRGGARGGSLGVCRAGPGENLDAGRRPQHAINASDGEARHGPRGCA